MDRLPPEPLPPWLSSLVLKLPPLGRDAKCAECGYRFDLPTHRHPDEIGNVTGDEPDAETVRALRERK